MVDKNDKYSLYNNNKGEYFIKLPKIYNKHSIYSDQIDFYYTFEIPDNDIDILKITALSDSRMFYENLIDIKKYAKNYLKSNKKNKCISTKTVNNNAQIVDQSNDLKEEVFIKRLVKKLFKNK